jgi:hypothetical protein
VSVKGAVIKTVLLLVVVVASFGQTSHPPDLTALEENVAKQLNEVRTKAGMKPLRFRRDSRMRMEACSVQIKGPDPKVEHASRNGKFSYKFLYLSSNPIEPSDELAQLAGTRTTFDNVAVGVWFAVTETHPSGMYWVIVYPEHSSVHEGFWSHFYLTDDFEYQTVFDKHWKEQLPQRCRSIK